MELVLDFEIFTSIPHVDLRVVPIQLWAVIHEQFTNDMRAMQPCLYIVGVVERQICQSSQNRAEHAWIVWLRLALRSRYRNNQL